MVPILYGLFLLCVLALVLGCFAYLFATRDSSGDSQASGGKPEPLSRDVAKKAEELSGSYRLSDLESIFKQLGALEAWGVVLELRFTKVQEEIQMIVNRNEVELCAPIIEPSYMDLFLRAAREAGLQARTGYTEGQYCVDVTGPWPETARTLRSIIRSIYGVDDSEEAQARIF